MRRASAALVFTAIALVYACGPKTTTPPGDNESTLLAQDGTDANEVESQASSLSASLTLAAGSASGVPKAQTLMDASMTTASFYFPSQCLTVTKPTASQVEYAFTDCTGPWGILHVSGTIFATLSDTPNGLQVDVGGAAPGTPATLHFNKAVATYQATAVVSSPMGGLTRSMTWTGMLNGMTARGRSFERTANWTIGWKIGDSCVSIDGSATGTIVDRSVTTAVTGYQRCRGQCPMSGMVTITNDTTMKHISLTYDGSDMATFTGVDNHTYDITLACGL